MIPPELFRHIWILFIAVTVANALALKFRARRHIEANPELAEGYRRLFSGVLFWGNLPWLIVGVGIEFGGVPNVFSYFRPRDGNPFVLAWFTAVIALWLLGFYWIFNQRGAEFLIEHPGLLRGEPKSPTVIKFLYCAAVGAGMIALVEMFLGTFSPFAE
jgi:uncharacterized membrane protein